MKFSITDFYSKCDQIHSFLHKCILLYSKMHLILNATYCNASYCSSKVQAELNRIKELITWNGLPKWIGRTLIAKKLKNINTVNNKNQLTNENNENVMLSGLIYLISVCRVINCYYHSNVKLLDV